MDNRTDGELVAAARTGDKDAFGMLVERYQAMAEHIARRMLASEDLARELAQEAFLQAYLSLDTLRDDERFRSWLYGIVLNVCRNYIRREPVVPLSLEEMNGGALFDVPLAETELSPEQIAEEHELQGIVLSAVSSLSPADRTATLLFYYEQLSLDEIAAVLGISVAAVKGRLYKSRRRLRYQLEPVYDPGRMVRMNDVNSEKQANAVPVTIVDLRRAKNPDGVDHVIMLLLDEKNQRLLPIWIGQYEGEAIKLGIQQVSTTRPMTMRFMADMLSAAHVDVEAVRIESLKDETFYAIVKVVSAGGVREVDARPSDAVALAVYMRKPIYATTAVFTALGQTRTGNQFLSWAKDNHMLLDESADGSLLGKELSAIMEAISPQ